MQSNRPLSLTTCLFAAVIVMAPLGAGAAVDVTFEAPEHYRDAGLYRDYGVDAGDPALRYLREHLEDLGETMLPEGADLSVTVVDVDLAGRFEWWHGYGYDIRILRDITWPSISLRYVLKEGDRVVAEGEETVADMTYLQTTPPSLSRDPLRYEKAMLTDWFRSRFGNRRGEG